MSIDKDVFQDMTDHAKKAADEYSARQRLKIAAQKNGQDPSSVI